MTPRIAFTITAYPPSMGGAQMHTHLLAQALGLQGHHPRVAAFWDKNRTDWLGGTTWKASPGSDWNVDGVPVRRIGMSLVRRLLHLPVLPMHYPFPRVTTGTLSRLLEPSLDQALPSDVEILHHVRIGREILARSTLSIARRRKIPFVLTPLHHPRWTGWRYAEWLRIYGEADALFTLTKVEKEVLISLGVKPDVIHVVGHAPVLPSCSPTNSPAKQPCTILFLGQHYPYKGWRTLLDAAPLVWDTHPEARFVFAGPDVEGSAKAFLDTDPRIQRVGMVEEAIKVRLLSECTMLVLPSSQESFGGVFTEAWSFGKPVIGCPIPAVSELIREGENGLLRPQSAADLAQGIVALLDNPDAARRMGSNGRKLVEEQFTWPKIASKVAAGYQAAIERLR